MVKLIVNADDMGVCPHRSKGILRLIEEKKVSSVSLMVNMGYSAEAGAAIKERNISAGLHLNLTEGVPLHLPSSLAPAGEMLGKQGLRTCLAKVEPQDIRKEIEMQL